MWDKEVKGVTPVILVWDVDRRYKMCVYVHYTCMTFKIKRLIKIIFGEGMDWEELIRVWYFRRSKNQPTKLLINVQWHKKKIKSISKKKKPFQNKGVINCIICCYKINWLKNRIIYWNWKRVVSDSQSVVWIIWVIYLLILP